MKDMIEWVRKNILSLVALGLLIFIIYETINALLGHSLDATALGFGVLVSFSVFIANQIAKVNENIKDMSKEIALGLKEISHKLDKKK